jgi:GDP/UDP-N,N'-diacetylbacillosamine 2-epimerase (hydrolysing)
MSRSFRIAVFTGNRSEFGLFFPIVSGLAKEGDFDCRIFAGGVHLAAQPVATIEEVEAAAGSVGVKVIRVGEPAIYASGNEALAWVSSFLPAFSLALDVWKPDAVFVYGDRVEAFAASTVAFLKGLPLLHMGAGNVTSGGLWDDSLRHSISKLAHLLFVTCHENHANALALAEEPWRVNIVGSPSVERMLSDEAPSFAKLSAELSDGREPLAENYLLFTLHPDVKDDEEVARRTKICIEALIASQRQVLITGPNGDPGSERIRELLVKATAANPGFYFRDNLGAKNYLTALRYCGAVVGNSSSGVNETPLFRKPAIDIGDRQKGRARADNVLNVPYEVGTIVKAIEQAFGDKDYLARLAKMENPFDHGRPSQVIAKILRSALVRPDLLVKSWPLSHLQRTE